MTTTLNPLSFIDHPRAHWPALRTVNKAMRLVHQIASAIDVNPKSKAKPSGAEIQRQEAVAKVNDAVTHACHWQHAIIAMHRAEARQVAERESRAVLRNLLDAQRMVLAAPVKRSRKSTSGPIA